MARPTKLKPETSAKIVEAIRGGNTKAVAAAVAGIHVGTFYAWLDAGAKAKTGALKEFYDVIKQAEAEAVAMMVDVIVKAAPTTWQAAAWFLERRYPDDWGRKDRVDLAVLVGAEVKKMVVEMGLDPEDEAEITREVLRLLPRAS